MKIIPKCIKTKRHLCASGSILLPLAQKWGLVGMMVMCALSGIVAQNVSAMSLEITISPKPLSVEITPSKEGSFSKANGVLSVTSDAYWGYTLSIRSGDSSGSNALKNGTNQIPSILKDSAEDQFATNSWGYAFAKGMSPATMFHPGPDAKGTDLDKTSGNGADTQKTETRYTFTLGTNVNNEVPTGAYSNTFIFTATANTASYTITYNAGTAKNVTNIPNTTNGTTYDLTGQVAQEEPEQDKYVFMGWCDKTPTVDDEGIETCKDGHQYEPSEDYRIAKASDNTLQLTAMWGLAMQNWDGCSSLPKDNTTTVTVVDSRDRNRYKIIKFEDACWMLENLRLGSNSPVLLSNADTDFDDDKGFELPASEKQDFPGDDVARVYVDSLNPQYGGYYSWFAATAGKGLARGLKGEIHQSICPKGWRLPSDSEGIDLTKEYNYSTIQDSAIKLQILGRYSHDNSCYGLSCNSASWWLSLADGDDGGRFLELTRSSFLVSNSGWMHGFSIRCVSRN